jgi:hypothetical protein
VILRVPLGSVVPKLPLLYVHRANLMAHRMEMGWRRPPELIVYRQGTKFVHVGDSEVLAAYKMALAPSQMVNVRVLRWGYKNPFDPHSREGKFWIGGFESSSPKPPESVPESMLPIWKDGWAAAVEQRDGHFQHREGKNVRTQ